MGTFLKYSAGLIATYLVVSNATGFGKLISNAGSAGSSFARTLQGR